MLLDGQPGGGAEEPGVAVAATPVGPALGDRVHHLDAAPVGGGDEPGDVGQRAR
ncbi:hypothetical protein GCM10010253_53000 [Streptomyces badius]|uniref:Uncharacterized protein n=1 Tax=Streptomyces badius TaxID=1941 RepID=A0ABQ2TIL5_STRBA|nr:hypothetical protein GCM10010253_53000 [Streptomyces badius]